MAKVQKLEESLCATEKVISSLEKSRDADKVGSSLIPGPGRESVSQ